MAQDPKRISPEKLLLGLLDKHGLNFVIQKQKIRHMEDGGVLVEPGLIAVFYKDQIPAKTKEVKVATKENGRQK